VSPLAAPPRRAPRRRPSAALDGGAAHSTADRAAGGHRAANRVVDLLEVMAASGDGLALRELSARLDAPKTSLLPLLRALTARRYLDQAATGEYRLGPKAVELGAGVGAQRELPAASRPALAELMRRTGETVYLSTLSADGASVVFIDKLESAHIIRYAAGVGDRRPLHATSSGKAILAFLPEPRREELLRSLPLSRYTERTVTSPAALRAALEEIRHTGVSVTLDELARGAAGIAAPVFDRDGRVVGACAIGAPTDRVRARLRQLGVDVRAAARAISTVLGHRPPDTVHDRIPRRPPRR
jgi:IclR family transcriptional regulator, acetate operon repressor